MKRTFGYHIVVSGYGLWLPGDERGHWSSAWDEELGYIEPHKLHPADPVRKRMAEERMKRLPFRLDQIHQQVFADVLNKCQVESDWHISALAIESTHTHLLLTYTKRDIENTVKWIKDQATKAIHRQTAYQGPLWCKGSWISCIDDDELWENTVRYIDAHNIRRRLDAKPFDWVGRYRR